MLCRPVREGTGHKGGHFTDMACHLMSFIYDSMPEPFFSAVVHHLSPHNVIPFCDPICESLYPPVVHHLITP